MNFHLKEFHPTLRFVGIFVGLYLVLNLLYGLWVTAYDQVADPATQWVTRQSAGWLRVAGEDVQARPKEGKSTISICRGDDTVVNVFEGCNGINVMIVFVAFVVAFGGATRKMLWFIPSGILIIHLANLLRVGGLYLVAAYFAPYFYYVHKYAFTASIYVIVAVLWWWWIERVNKISLRRSIKQ